MVAPLVALVALVLIGIATFLGITFLETTLGGTETDAPGAVASPVAVGSPDPGASPSGEAAAPSPTPTPDLGAVETPAPDVGATVKGTILFARGGNIWSVSGQEYTQISRKGTDSTPAWAPDGSEIYFVETRTREADGIGPAGKYTLYYPNIMKMKPNGKKRKPVYESLIRKGDEYWFSWVLQPDVSPNGKTIALVSDGNDGQGEVALHTLPARGGRLTPLPVATRNGLGHNDPAWSPDGKRLAFTLNTRDGQIGAPIVGIYTPKTGRTELLKRGYANPSWSPDGRWLAAERTTGNGRDVVILDPARGAELARLTNDGNSFSPVVSPDGDQIAYLHRKELGIDLRIMTLAFENGRITLVADQAVTEDGSIDAESPPAWFIPADERGVPPSALIPEASPSASAASSPDGAGG